MTGPTLSFRGSPILRRALVALDQGEPRMNLRRLGLDALHERLADRALDLDAVLRAVVDATREIVAADRATLYLVDQARQELVSRAAHLPEITEIRLQMGQGLAGWVAQTGQRVNLREGRRDPRHAPQFDARTGYSTRTLLAMPLRDAKGHTIGVLQVLNKQGGAFEESDEAILAELCVEIAELLGRSTLGPQLQSRNPRPLSFGLNRVIGDSTAMRLVTDRTLKAARSEATVLVRGESGSGKELVARAVHDNSTRSSGPFVVVDLAALPHALMESELFGHMRGAFTSADRDQTGRVEAATGGTLFLDEIGELPLPMQAKLLRLLQERSYVPVGASRPRTADVRFVTATHRDLEQMVAAGQFRQDLYYRVRVVEITLPPLRARGADDLDRLIDHLLDEAAARHRRGPIGISAMARSQLHAHRWPGNVRELQHTLESAVVLADGPLITAVHLPTPTGSPGEEAGPLRTLAEVEAAHIQRVLNATSGNQSEAARILGIGRNTLARKLRGEPG